MAEEETKQTKPQEPQEEKKLSIVEEAKAIRDEIARMKEELKTENDRKERLMSEEMLAGTNGGHIEKKEVPKPTPREYAEAALRGDFNGKKEE